MYISTHRTKMCPLCICCIQESVANRSTSFNINIYCLCCLENVLQSQRYKNNNSNAPSDTIWLHHVAFSKGFQLMASTIQWWLSFINVPKGRIWPVLSSDHNYGVFFSKVTHFFSKIIIGNQPKLQKFAIISYHFQTVLIAIFLFIGWTFKIKIVMTIVGTDQMM